MRILEAQQAVVCQLQLTTTEEEEDSSSQKQSKASSEDTAASLQQVKHLPCWVSVKTNLQLHLMFCFSNQMVSGSQH